MLKYEFPTIQKNSKKIGVDDGGTQQFKAGFMYHLTREALQNIMDAGLKNGLPARAEFSLEKWNTADFPDPLKLSEIIADCARTHSKDEPVQRFCKCATELLGNEKIPFLAHQMFFEKLFVLLPKSRSGLLYGTPICLKPTQALSPRRKISFSGKLNIFSTTLLSIKEKSPASTGTATSESLRNIR